MIHIEVEEFRGVIILNFQGEFLLDTISQVKDVWTRQVEKQPEIIAINCSKIDYIDSTAIGTLVQFFNHAMNNNIRLVFFDLKPKIRELFSTARLHRFFKITSMENFSKEYLQNIDSR